MAKRLRTTSALAGVVMILVSACGSSSTSPSAAASVAASVAPPPSAAASAAASASAAPSAAPSAAAAPAVPTVPTGYTELDKALGARQAVQRQDGVDPDPVDRWRGHELRGLGGRLRRRRPASTIQIDSIGSSHETVLKTRIEGGAAAGHRPARPADPRPGLRGRGQGHRRGHVHGCQEAQRRASGDHRPGHPGRQDLGHPVQGRRQVDHLVPDQGLRGQGLHRSRRRGTS